MSNFAIREGDLLRIRTDLNINIRPRIEFGLNSEMVKHRGEVVTVHLVDDDQIIIKKYGYTWHRDMFEEVIQGIKNEQEVEEERDYLDFKVGDTIRIRSADDLDRIYGHDGMGIKTYVYFTDAMKKFSGQKATIQDVFGKFVRLSFMKNKINEVKGDYTFSTDMIEIYKKEEKTMLEEKVDEVNEDELIKEMISKVDIKKFKKILASAFAIPSTHLLGVDKILQNWAKAKKGLYQLLGNNIKVSKEIEYIADERYWKEEKHRLAKAFPGIGYMLLDIPEKRFISNDYVPFSSKFDELMKDAKMGMKLTTFLSNAFHNQDFDIALSKSIEASTVKGCIVISIDPVDFLTMSFNQSGWKSCHTISCNGGRREFGEFVRRYI